MVFVRDEGSVFDASLERIWQLHLSPSEHRHPSMKNFKAERTADPFTFMATWEAEAAGAVVPVKVRFVFFPPLGFAIDYVEGPLAGSKEFQYYTPMGGKTGITCVGIFQASGLSDDELRDAALHLYDVAFREDEANLARIK